MKGHDERSPWFLMKGHRTPNQATINRFHLLSQQLQVQNSCRSNRWHADMSVWTWNQTKAGRYQSHPHKPTSLLVLCWKPSPQSISQFNTWWQLLIRCIDRCWSDVLTAVDQMYWQVLLIRMKTRNPRTKPPNRVQRQIKHLRVVV